MRNDNLLPFCRVKHRRVADFVLMVLYLFHGGCPMKSYGGVQALTADASYHHRYNRLSPSSSSSPCSLLIVGLGRVGLEVAQLALLAELPTSKKDGSSSDSIPAFSSIWGTVREISSDSPAFEDGIQRVSFQHLAVMERHEADNCFRQATHILITLPAASLQDSDELVHQTVAITDTLKNYLISKSSCCWIGVISTTGVYGNHDGAWVTEDSECRSDDKLWLLWEDYWKEIAVSEHRKAPVAVRLFRCAGIYGGSKSALHTVYRNGLHLSPVTTRNNDVDSVTNRIHVFDLARAVVSSMLMEATHNRTVSERELDYPLRVRTYNLADNLPASRQHVLQYACNLLRGVSAPNQTTLPLGVASLSTVTQTRDETAASNRASRRRTDQKRVSNQRLREELLPQLMYPTYKEGLQAILNDRRNPWWKVSINDD